MDMTPRASISSRTATQVNAGSFPMSGPIMNYVGIQKIHRGKWVHPPAHLPIPVHRPAVATAYVCADEPGRPSHSNRQHGTYCLHPHRAIAGNQNASVIVNLVAQVCTHASSTCCARV